MTPRYHNGEPVIKDCIQNEPWYPHYQALMEVAMRTGHTDVDTLYQAYIDDWQHQLQFSDSFTHEMILRWVVLHACLNRCLEEERKSV